MGRPVEDQLEKLIGEVGGFPGHDISYVVTRTNGLGVSIRAVTRGVVRRTKTDALSETSGRAPRQDVFSGRHDKFGRQDELVVIRGFSPGDSPRSGPY